MEIEARRRRWARVMAIVGAVLVWLPIAAPLVLGVAMWIRRGRLLVDFLMPAELFPLILAGGALLLTAALLTRQRRALVAGLLGGAVALLVGSQGIAVATGLASGRNEPTGWRLTAVLGPLALFIAAVVALGVVGVLLARELRGERPAAAHEA